MREMWRVIDTGLRTAAQNIALNRALLGYHQSAEQEFNLDYCRANQIAVQRRITGGGAIFIDETQLGWELYLHRRDVDACGMQAVARRICHAAATAISALGVDARYRPRHDIEVDGRKISGTGGAFDGDALLYQGTLLIGLDVEKMLRVLRIPAEKLSDKAIATARERVANLTDLLGRRPDPDLVKRNLTEAFESEFDVEFQEGDLTLTEHARYQVALAQIDTPDWIDLVRRPASDMPLYESVQKVADGMLRVSLTYDRLTHRIRQIWFSGDIFVNPRRTLADLEAALRDTSVERVEHNVRVFFTGREVDMLALTPEDFIAVIRLAAKQPIVASSRA